MRRHYSEDGGMEITRNITTGETSFVFYLTGDAYDAPAIYKEVHAPLPQGGVGGGLYYLHRDHLGSIVLITDVDGNAVEKRQFDAWGNIVALTDGAGNPLTAFVITDRGYTGHEHLLAVGLINMNGRLYDPKLHRFLSPDNFVQDPSNTQNFNRYGYVMNNPLFSNDPSGEIIPFVAIVIGAAIIGGGANLYANRKDIKNFWDGVYYFGVGAAVGAGATVGGAALAPVLGTGAIAGAVLGTAGGFVTGFANTMYGTGGNWGASFRSAGWGALWGGVGGAVIGGTVSAIRGNNFWTGAARMPGQSAFSIAKNPNGPSFNLKDTANIFTKNFWKYGYNPKAQPGKIEMQQFGERIVSKEGMIGGRENREWESLFEWGARPEGALDKLSNVSPADVLRLKSAGVSLDNVIQWRDFYSTAINKAVRSSNVAAKYRMDLMKRLIELW